MSILHDSLIPGDHGVASVVIESITKWQVTFACGFNGTESPHDDLIPHPERMLAYELGRAIREGMERMEVEPDPAEWTDVDGTVWRLGQGTT